MAEQADEQEYISDTDDEDLVLVRKRK